MNLSETGIGLVAHPAVVGEGPKEGEEVELTFGLPGQRGRITAKGLVRWRHEATRPQEGLTAALGVQFLRFPGSDQLKLARYLANHRVKVVVIGTPWRAERLLREAVGNQVELLFVSDAREQQLALERGDVSAVLVQGALDERTRPLIDDVLGATAGQARGGPGDVAPPLVYWGPASPHQLVELFNTGRLYRALPPEPSEAELRATISGACQSHGMRLEQLRMGLELERHLLREGRSDAAGGRPVSFADAPGLQSAPMRRAMELARIVAPHRVAVLVQGETGTGKEVLSRAIHQLSTRTEAAFVVQDCGALPETLLESELFGHVKGAFTGAVSDHRGLFELADGGTILLDEIENTTANFQTKLLRVLETGEVRPVGASEVRQVDVRILAASNRPLEEEVRLGRFRSDLFYRLNTFVIDLPPLRERHEDLLALAEHFIAQLNQTLGKHATGLAPETEEVLRRFDWPGNVRELRNVLERAVLLTPPGQAITPAQLPDRLVARALGRLAGGEHRSFADRIADAERNILRDALDRSGGVLRRAAQELQMDAVTLGRRARKLGLWPARSAGAPG